jgi:hypothetical protein
MVSKEEEPMKCIAVLTSGGDAPGMNAAIRAGALAAGHPLSGLSEPWSFKRR